MATANRGRGRRPPRRSNHEDNFENVVVQHPAVANLAEALLPQRINLPITTRGIGMSVCSLTYMSSQFSFFTADDSSDEDEIIIPVPDIHALYRLFLGLLEYKLYRTCISSSDTYRYVVTGGWSNVAESVRVPKQIQHIINAVGVFTHNEKTYVPVVAKDIDGVPRPENLLLSNLRRAVKLLSNPETLIEHRKYFYDHNPIPGSQWNKEEYLLLNAEEIIKADYNDNYASDFQNDWHAVQNYLDCLYRNSKQKPAFACDYIKFTSDGEKSLLMSNKMGTLRVPDRGSKELGTYCRSCLLEGDIEDYYTLSKLSVTSDNILCLLGECPEPITCNDPLYNLRRETVNGFIVMNYLRVSYSSYMTSLMDFNHGASMMTLHSPIPLTLSVTTRGIGMSICHLVYAASSYKAIPMPDIYALYRLCLGLLEVKLSQDMYTPAHVTDTYRYLSNADLNHIAQSVWVPKQIQCLINAVGKMQHEGITYVPAVAKDVTDDAGAVPRPENLLLSNLRRAVELLSGPATLVQHRKYFYEHNPIPGALWDNEKYLLLNADQIIPADYETNLVTNFKRDCEAIQPYLKSLCRYSIQMPGFACGGVDLKSNGKKFLLISNQIGKVWRSNQTGKLKVPDRGTNEDLGTYCKKCHPEGDIASYYALSKLSGYEVLLGTTSLLGERPEGARFNTDPVYDLRSETITGFRSISLSYKQVSGLIYAYC